MSYAPLAGVSATIITPESVFVHLSSQILEIALLPRLDRYLSPCILEVFAINNRFEPAFSVLGVNGIDIRRPDSAE
jgi:hypothetical protein